VGYDVRGKRVLVTGASSGIGAGLAVAFAKAGATVGICARREGRLRDVLAECSQHAPGSRMWVTDLAVPEEVDGLAAAAVEELGGVDVLVNNAGIPPGFRLRPFRELPVEDWDAFVRLNLYGVLHCAKATVDGMCDRGWGRIVTISSEAGRMGLPTGVSLYGASKAAAIGFSRHLALELVGTGVTVNCVALGLIARGREDDRRPPWPTARLGRPDDIAGAVCYLASDAASWVTGQVLGVNGGALTP
jgi:NAD(P)-dependent dehydrogenase (short-subunit alcohol dehydrogenase family)